jgi:hypothetical protein
MSLSFRVIDVGPPKKPVRRTNADGNLTLVQRLLLYDFLEVREYIGLVLGNAEISVCNAVCF